MKYTNGDVYEGDLRNGVHEGRGLYRYTDVAYSMASVGLAYKMA